MEILELKKELKARKITYKELSQKSGVPEGTIKNIMRGAIKSPGINIMNALYKAAGIDESQASLTPSYFVNDDEMTLIKNFRLLSPSEKEVVSQMIQGLIRQKESKAKNA